MLKVNLISKKKRTKRDSNLVVIPLISLFIVFVAYFVGLTVYVAASLYWVNNKLSTVKNESIVVSQEMLANNDLLKKYILSKLILGKIGIINRDKFHYKDYLDQIVGLLPQGVALQNVDFSNKGWVSVAVTVPNLSLLNNLEKVISDNDLLIRGAFSSIYTEGLVKNKTGKYDMTLQFEIRKNV